MELKQKTTLRFKRTDFYLLIVPYGIETYVHFGLITWISSFNRTLWN